MESKLDRDIDALSKDLAALDSWSIAVFAAAVSERLLAFIEWYLRSECRTDCNSARDALDWAWTFLAQQGTREGGVDALAGIRRDTPGPEALRSPVAVVAQNVSIALDSTLCWCLNTDNPLPVAGEYGMDAVRAIATLKATGSIQVGTDAEGIAFEATLARHPLIRQELNNQRNDLSTLQRTDATLASILSEVKQRAECKRLCPESAGLGS